VNYRNFSILRSDVCGNTESQERFRNAIIYNIKLCNEERKMTFETTCFSELMNIVVTELCINSWDNGTDDYWDRFEKALATNTSLKNLKCSCCLYKRMNAIINALKVHAALISLNLAGSKWSNAGVSASHAAGLWGYEAVSVRKSSRQSNEECYLIISHTITNE
jgi:hypothetical protein